MKPIGFFLGTAILAVLASCAKKDDPILQGEREGIREVLTAPADAASITEAAPATGIPPLSLPPTRANTNWTQAIGTPATRTAHPALGNSLQMIWSVPIGEGDGKRARISADPVVADGRVFTLDAHARVTAVSTNGQVLWTQDLVPPNDSASDGSGGGLAYGNGKLFVSSGFGLLTALDAKTGAQIWQQSLQATGSGSPAVAGNLVYLVAGDDVAWAIDTETGRIRWQLAATPDINNVFGAPSPAVSDKYVVFGFGSGELQGALRKGGLRLWDSQIAGQRHGYSAGGIDDITGDPVIEGDRIFVGNHSGRTVALGLANGKRLWTAPDGPLNPVWPAGDSIFMITDRNELLRLSAEDGSRLWAHTLPFFTKDKPKRQAEIFAHHGPVIAGGKLIVASNDGQMRFFDPATGTPRGVVALPGGATTNPVVAGGTLYVVSTKGKLLAFR